MSRADRIKEQLNRLANTGDCDNPSAADLDMMLDRACETIAELERQLKFARDACDRLEAARSRELELREGRR